MTAATLASLVRLKTRTTSATFTDADMLVYVKASIDKLAGRMQQIRPAMWNMPATFDLEANTREYGFPTDTLNNIVSLELKFSASGDYVPATSLKKHPSSVALQESLIVAAYTNADPFYFVRRKALFILSGTIATVAAGGRLVYNAFPAHPASMTATDELSTDPSTTTHGFPREFHELLAQDVSIEFKSNNPEIPLGAKDLSFEKDLQEALDAFSTANMDVQETADMPSGASMSNNGFDL